MRGEGMLFCKREIPQEKVKRKDGHRLELMAKENIVLIGMAGAGKSTTGVVVAKIMKKDFIDGDLLIQHETGKGLQDIIDEAGNDGFRRIEEEILLSIESSNAVIAPGGSAIYYPRVMERFKKDGLIVYLHVPLQEIEERLGNLETRGVTLEAGQSVAELYQERILLYEAYADITIEAGGKSLEETVDQIVKEAGACFASDTFRVHRR